MALVFGAPQWLPSAWGQRLTQAMAAVPWPGAVPASATATSPSPATTTVAAAPTSAAAVTAPDAGANTRSATRLLGSNGLPPDHPENRLLAIYALIESGDLGQALARASELTRDYPHFQLAQLVHGDLLKLRYQPSAPVATQGPSVPVTSDAKWSALRAESRRRLDALHHRPLPGTVPHQLVALSGWSKHAIAVDASRSRLYLFENLGASAPGGESSTPNLRLVADYFMSVGKAGIDKRSEGDARTPLGNYYITSVRDRKSLPAFYGAGALPINYPNAFDTHEGRTGSGIWLHGTPPDQFVRAPQASDGCVVLSNPDMQRLLDVVEPRTTPVIIAESLQWVDPKALQADRTAFEAQLQAWQDARTQMDASQFFAAFALSGGKTLWPGKNGHDLLVTPGARLGIRDVSLLQTRHPKATMVATFEETVNGQATGVVRRQYWLQGDPAAPERWRLVQDTVLAGTPSASLKRVAPPATAVAQAPATASYSNGSATAARNAPPGDRAAENGNADDDRADVRDAVQAWARAWSQKNMAGYLRAYDASFDPPDGQSRRSWEQERRDRIVSKTRISVTVSGLKISVRGDRATAQFTQHYRADALNVSGRKTLTLVRRGGEWRITQESVGGRG